MEVENIQLGEDLKKEGESASAILHQNDYKAENLDANINVNKAKAKHNDFTWAEGQYLTFNPSIFETFFTNSVSLPVKTTNSSKSKKVDCSHKKLFITIIVNKKPEYYLLKPAVVIQLEK